MKTFFELPEFITRLIHERLRELKLKPDDFSFLAEQIQKLSDFYIANPSAPTPYQSPQEIEKSPWAEVASLIYFFPLNYLRNLKVFREAHRLQFFQGLDQVIEFGAGFGPSSWALKTVERDSLSASFAFKDFHWLETSPLAQTYADLFARQFKISPQVDARFGKNIPSKTDLKNTLAVFSYSFTELSQLPDWAEHCQALAIIEPSTQEDARRLQALRPQLIKMGFSLWAPCLHEQDCPLLKHSPKDWCHDRLLFHRPPWLEKIETHLAWENKSLTFSYLLARKKAPPWKGKTFSHEARVIGDTLFEKGKTRQMICKDEDRLFLAWLNKQGPAPELPRGSWVKWNKDELKSNEIRPDGPIIVTEEIST